MSKTQFLPLLFLSLQKLEICAPEGSLIIPRLVESFQLFTKIYSIIIDTPIPKAIAEF